MKKKIELKLSHKILTVDHIRCDRDPHLLAGSGKGICLEADPDPASGSYATKLTLKLTFLFRKVL
jgi:hypothetical protein